MTRLLMTADAVGGVWQYATELAAALRPHEVEVVLAVLGPTQAKSQASGKGEGEPQIIHTDLPLDWLATGPDEVLAAGEAIARLAQEVGADLVHLNSPALAARARFTAPVVAVAHGCVGTWWQAARGCAPEPAYAWHGELMRAGLRAADACVAPSAAFAETLRRTYNLPVAPLVVHNGRAVSPAADAPPTDAVFTAGRLWDQVKNAALLDRMAARLAVPVRAAGTVAGPHGERADLRYLDLLGTLDDAAVAVELAARPVYVSAAMFEPFGLSVLEAAAAGCPLILSNIDTFRELWTGAALLVPDQDPDAYAAAVNRVLADGELRTHLGEAARVRAQRYTPQAMAGAMAAIYAGLLAEAPIARIERAAA